MSLPLLELLVLFLISSHTPVVKADENCDPLFNYRFRLTQTLHAFDLRVFSAWSGGGGPVETLPEDTGTPFAGRPYGSAGRGNIHGSRAYGSGYPGGAYDVQDPSTINGRGFPYGTWPIAWENDYGGGGEYGGDHDVWRPGGQLVQIPLVPKQDAGDRAWDDTSKKEQTYWIIGDRDSALSVISHLQGGCAAEANWPELFTQPGDRAALIGDRNDTENLEIDGWSGVTFEPANVIQYYRASSFALALPAYNNTFAYAPLNGSTLLSHDDSEPLPDGRDENWLRCINDTIAGALPIIDQPYPKPMAGGIVAAIVLSTVLGPWILICAVVYLCKLNTKRQISRNQKETRLATRQTQQDYELYP